jgi:hypothetical protein
MPAWPARLRIGCWFGVSMRPREAHIVQRGRALLRALRATRTVRCRTVTAFLKRALSRREPAVNVRCFIHARPLRALAASAVRLARQGFGQMRIIADFPHCHCRTMCHNRSALRMTAGGCIHQPARAHRRFARPGKAGDVIRNTRLTKHTCHHESAQNQKRS